MKIVIPMSGTGDRYRRAGYPQPKPLLPVDGRPMIEHVIDLFPGEKDFVFICNREHLETTPLASVLQRARPEGRIVPIAPHKLGPVHAVLQALETFRDDEEVIVNYCDFGAGWDYASFLREVRERKADGALSAYRGFHPHSLGTTNYAYLRHADRWMIEIQEKKPFTQNRLEEYASSGTYYFARGSHVKKYFPQLVRENLHTNGEFYVSMVYNLLQRDRLKIWIHDLEFFLQWGTPEDLEEYQYWSDHFRKTTSHAPCSPSGPAARTYNLMLMAGRGSRFTAEGYALPKPLIPVDDAPMVVQAARSLPPAQRWGVIALQEIADRHPIRNTLEQNLGSVDFLALDHVTEGQACTARLASRFVDPDQPLLIASCDQGLTWDGTAYDRLLADPSVDAVVWTFRRHAGLARNPKAYGWVATEGNLVRRVSVKVPISDNPRRDHAVIGTFWFRRAGDFFDTVDAMVRDNRRINREFYIDEAINVHLERGKRVAVFEVDHYLGWGTPNDLRTYEYWSRYFRKYHGRP